MLYERYAKRRFQEGIQEGRQAGRVERDKEWDCMAGASGEGSYRGATI